MIRDDCNEVHGMDDAAMIGGHRGDRTRVLVTAQSEIVKLNVAGYTYSAGLNPAQARYLARKLYRCARLVEQRLADPA